MLTGSSMAQIVFTYARSRPDRLCVADPRESMSYSQMAERIAEKARQLRSLGIRPGDRVVAVSVQRGDFLALQFAVQMLGAVFIPVEKRIPDAALEKICGKAEPALVLRNPDLKSLVAGTAPEVLPHFLTGEPERIATILFTTGTTGESKGIMLSHRAEVAVAQNVLYGTRMEEDTIELIPAPVNHAYGLRHCFGLLLGGRSVVLCDGVTMAEDFFGMMDRYGVNALSLTPAFVNILLHLTGDRLGSYAGRIRYLQLGTAGVDMAMKERLRKLLPGSRLYQYYSSTEAGCACIFDFRNDYSARRVGKPAVNSIFAVLDENGKPVTSDENHWGYLSCKGPMNMSGYYGEPLLTEKTVINGYVRSGDLGYIDSEGYICFAGRAGDVINSGGYKISPEEVESEAMLFGNLRECALAAKEDPVMGQVPWLFIVPEDKEDPRTYDQDALLRFLAGRLERYKLPVKMVVIDQIPRNGLGKMIRSRCFERIKDGMP